MHGFAHLASTTDQIRLPFDNDIDLACAPGGIHGHKGRSLKNTACPKTKHFEFFSSWVTERSDWLEYRFEFMIDRKVLLVFIYDIGIN